ncbi:hypothetical protein [Streptomyces incanus]|uniref:Uncharacterized protein n=1 Tax=Streptomyces incanus TaxID=887453 RepID=A0ABW0XYN7_9ACTN
MIVLQPVLEVYASTSFTLWPIAEAGQPYGFLPLDGTLSVPEVGTAVMRIADCNDMEPEAGSHPQKPADPLGAFLYGLLTLDDLFASGGLRVTDTVTGVTLLPGCCNGLEERGDWLDVLDGDGWASFGHDPSPLAERLDDGTVRLTIDAEQADSPVIELPAEELRRLLAGAEHDLTDFLRLAVTWTARHLPEHAASVTAALARVLTLPVPALPGRPVIPPGPPEPRAIGATG